MKNYLFLCILIVPFFIFSQNDNTEDHYQEVLRKYKKSLNKELDKYEQKNYAIQEKLLNENINNYLKSVIFGSSETNTNAESFSFSLNDDKTTITTTTLVPLNKSIGEKQAFLKLGLFASGKGNLFDLYSKESWQNDVGFNAGIIFKFKGGTYYNKSKKPILNEKRLVYADSLIFSKKFKKIEERDKLKAELDFAKAKMKANRDKCDKDCQKIVDEGIINFKNINDKFEKKGIKKVYDSLVKKQNIYNILDKELISGLPKDELYLFDKKNDITNGYSLWWFDFNINGINSSYNIKNDSILTEAILSSLELEKFKRKFRLGTQININYTKNNYSLFYAQLGASLTFGNLLDNNSIVGTPKLKLEEDDYFLIDDEENILGKYRHLDSNNTYGGINFYSSYFFTSKKNIGVSLSFKHHYIINSKNNDYFKSNFSLLFGPVFSNVGEDNFTKATFGLEFGFENEPYNTKINDEFIARLKVGIPFNVFKKKKS
ncbi:hypothetical protein R3X25_14305 [Lutibacter sp. TH_r2]|uniref:hypothetical protein n=1 Tax=Lutibacter sp. TH_r2 TaxID=3082083 RepID=UPI002952ECCE|nr:hypothetical protein [Lutibacter sp. TH_r2]MDV7188461.1 hypothetical protein [Lutibacter sp. TH_r2]